MDILLLQNGQLISVPSLQNKCSDMPGLPRSTIHKCFHPNTSLYCVNFDGFSLEARKTQPLNPIKLVTRWDSLRNDEDFDCGRLNSIWQYFQPRQLWLCIIRKTSVAHTLASCSRNRYLAYQSDVNQLWRNYHSWSLTKLGYKIFPPNLPSVSSVDLWNFSLWNVIYNMKPALKDYVSVVYLEYLSEAFVCGAMILFRIITTNLMT